MELIVIPRRLLLVSFFSLFSVFTFQYALAENSSDLAYEHLYEVMDQYHATYDVYTDLGAAGNHFVMLGKFDETTTCVTIDPGYRQDCYSGATCIENTYTYGAENLGGWYFLNGVLQGEETQPKANWGDYENAGIDLTGATKLTFYAKGKTGGEVVEFFAFGVGRYPATGVPLKPYPDSSAKVSLGLIQLTNKWQKYTLDVTVADISYVLGGFAWVASSLYNSTDITFYLDQIQYDLARLDEPRFLVSYATIPSMDDFDLVNKNVAFGYDNSLALLAFLARGTTEDIRRAGLIADAFLYAIDNDRFFADGRLRNGYQGGDLKLFPGWIPNGKKATVRMPGWWANSNEWLEDEFAVSTHVGNVIWPMISLLHYYQKKGGAEYLSAANILGQWVINNTKTTSCSGGFAAGFEGWEATSNKPAGQTTLTYRATEHNVDIYPAYTLMHQITQDVYWEQNALHAKSFVEAMWNSARQYFWTGTESDGCTINKDNDQTPMDIQAWALMVFDNYSSALRFVEDNCSLQLDGFNGFDFNTDLDGIWFEGVAQMTVAYFVDNAVSKANEYIAELESAQINGEHNNGKGIVASSRDAVTTGFDWLYYNRLHVGATAWFLLGKMKYNPYWGEKITTNRHHSLVPIINYLLLEKIK